MRAQVAQQAAQRHPRRIATRNGQPAHLSAPPRDRAPVPMADWLARPRPVSPLRAIVARLIGKGE